MLNSKRILDNFIWVIYVFYLFTILAFGDRVEYARYSNFAFVVMCCVMLFEMASRGHLYLYYNNLSLVPFVIFSFMSTLWSYYPDTTIERSVTLVRLLVLCIIVSMYVYHTDNVKKYLFGIAVSAVLVVLYLVAIYGFFQLRLLLTSSSRIGGAIVNENTLGVYMATAAIICLTMYLNEKKIIWLLGIVPLLIILFGTASRKAILDIAVGFLLVIILSASDDENKNRGKRFRALIYIIVFVCAAIIVWQMPIFNGMRERVEGLLGLYMVGSGTVDHSAFSRSQMISYGLKQFFSTPILGIGIGSSGYVTRLIDGTNSYLHNNYVELLATGGIIGTMLYYIPFIRLFFRVWKTRNHSIESRIIITLLAITFINDIAAVQYFSKITYIIFAISTAHVLIQNRKKTVSIQT